MLWPRLVECWAGHINNKLSPSGWLMMFFTLSSPQPDRRPQKGGKIQALLKHKLSFIPSLIYQKSNNVITELQNYPPTFSFVVVLVANLSKGTCLARVCIHCTVHSNNYKLLPFPCKTHDFICHSQMHKQVQEVAHACTLTHTCT